MALTRILARSLLSRNVPRVASCNYSDYHHDGPHVPKATLNDLPVPEGDWQENYQSKQRKNNLLLVGSIGFFLTCLTVLKESKLVHFNWSPPKTYE